jgi:SHS2 domain-containing protein
MPFEMIDHTADAGIHVWADNLPMLFSEAARGTFGLLTDPKDVEPKQVRAITVEGIDETDLLINMLREMLYLFTGEGLLVKTLDIESITGFTMSGRVGCEPYQYEKHTIRTEIKAVTYAGGEILKTPDGFEITVIFDV